MWFCHQVPLRAFCSQAPHLFIDLVCYDWISGPCIRKSSLSTESTVTYSVLGKVHVQLIFLCLHRCDVMLFRNWVWACEGSLTFRSVGWIRPLIKLSEQPGLVFNWLKYARHHELIQSAADDAHQRWLCWTRMRFLWGMLTIHSLVI